MSVAAATNALISVADVKYVWGREQADTTDDDRIQTLINLISGRIAEWCDRIFITGTYTAELYDGTGTEALVLRQRPVSTVTAIIVDGVAATVAEIAAFNTAGAAYKIDYPAGIIYKILDWSKGKRNISVTYAAGYASADIPPGLKEVCAEWVILLLEGRMKDADTQGRDVAAVDQMPARFSSALSRYRRPQLA